MTIRVALADDQALVRAGFRSLLERTPDFEVVGEAPDGQTAVALARDAAPDVLLMDIRMPGLDGLEATRRIVGDPDLRHVRVVILTTFDLDDYIFEALRVGASGFLAKNAPPEELRHAIRVVAQGEALLSPNVTRRIIEHFTRPAHSAGTAHHTTPAARPETLDALTDREREVLVLVTAGLTNTEIGQRLHLSPYTVKTHISRMLTKLAMRDRAQLVVIAYETGLVRPGYL
jgi:DNA-binding NarL/FixJ family response regulator